MEALTAEDAEDAEEGMKENEVHVRAKRKGQWLRLWAEASFSFRPLFFLCVLRALRGESLRT
jgi:hypothetical protein